jgi:PHS family inorganic phosphate transporter-like MFS transporter
LYDNAVGMIILTCAGSLPGYWTAVLTIDTLGRKPIQVVGFIILTAIFCILGFLYHSLSQTAMLVLYIVAQFFFNFGPNTTTFIVPGECYPTRYRSTGHGLSAAMGKIGAIIAQVISIPLLSKDQPTPCSGVGCSPWLDRLMQIFALFMLCGTFVSLLIPETKGITLEELGGEPPTSYNAGRNYSIGRENNHGRGWWGRLNPFGGGQPAGFFYPRANRGAWGGISPRSDIMSSPEMAAQNDDAGAGGSRHTNKGKGKNVNATRGKKKRVTSGESSDSAVSTASGGDELPIMSPGVLPGWGAGWGRIDRGAQPAAMQNVRLHDVGELLK